MKTNTIRQLSEEDVKHRYITPALKRCFWSDIQLRLEYRIDGSNNRVDYLLLDLHGKPLAIIEAKAPHRLIASGISQAESYAATLGVRFIFSTNGGAFYMRDLLSGAEAYLPMAGFPTPAQLSAAVGKIIRRDRKRRLRAQYRRRLRRCVTHFRYVFSVRFVAIIADRLPYCAADKPHAMARSDLMQFILNNSGFMSNFALELNSYGNQY